MLPKLVLCFLASSIAAWAAGGIDLTPVPHNTPHEGGAVSDVAFRTAAGIVTFRPPYHWSSSGDASKAVFRPQNAGAGAEMTITAKPKPITESFDPDTVKVLKAEVERGLPKDAKGVEWGDDEAGLLKMNRHETYRIAFSYSAYSERLMTTILFCNFAEMQLRFELTCRESDFKTLYQDYKESLYTLSGLK